MANVQYTGTSDVRELTKSDFKALGVEDHDKVTWIRGEDGKSIAEVDKGAVEALEKTGEFKVVADAPAEPSTGTGDGGGGEGGKAKAKGKS